MKIFVICVLVCLVYAVSSFTVQDCPHHLGMTHKLQVHGNSCFLFEYEFSQSFPDARRRCERLGGNLASVKTADVSSFLTGHMSQTYSFRFLGYTWIGLRFNEDTRAYTWTDGQQMDYSNLDTEKQTRDCIAMHDKTGSWKDFDCSKRDGEKQTSYNTPRNYICEFRLPFADKRISQSKDETSITVDQCPPGLARDKYLSVFGDKCYHFGTTKTKSKVAQAVCEKNNGRLAAVTSAKINDFLFDELANRPSLKSQFVYIGLQHNTDTGSLAWSNCQEVKFTKFNSQTDVPKKDAIGVLSKYTGVWKLENSNDFEAAYICEYDALDSNATTSEKENKKLGPEHDRCNATKTATAPTTPTTSVSPYKVEDCPKHLTKRGKLQVHANSCFLFEYEFSQSFPDARRRCERLGGNLASVKTADVSSFLTGQMRKTYEKYFNAYTWIGLRFNEDTWTYTWTDGQQMDYSNLDTQTHTRDCIAMHDKTGSWKDFDCSKRDGEKHTSYNTPRNYICEFRLPFADKRISQSKEETSITVDQCPPGLARDKHLSVFGDKCYHFGMNKTTHRDAETVCERNNGRLATIPSAKINDFLIDEMTERLNYIARFAFIGIRFRKSSGSLVWSNCKDLRFEKYDLKTDVLNEDTFGLLYTFSGGWLLGNGNDYKTAFICEYEAVGNKTTPPPQKC